MPTYRVDIFLVGAQKCASSSLFTYLDRHPGVAGSRWKEPGYFGSDDTSGRQAYLDLFDPAPGQLCMDGSTQYTFLPQFAGTVERIHAHNPEARIVYIVRDPVERIRSHMRHRWFYGRASDDFDAELASKPSYIARSTYSAQIGPYIDAFGPEQVRVLTTDAFSDPGSSARTDLLTWLGLDPELMPEPEAKVTANRSEDKVRLRFGLAGRLSVADMRRALPERMADRLIGALSTDRDKLPDLSPEMDAGLWELFTDSMRSLEQMTDVDLTPWWERRAAVLGLPAADGAPAED